MDSNVNCFCEDEIIICEGDTVPCMYYVLSGTALLYLNYHEKDEILLGACSTGKVFHEMGMLNNSPSLYTAVAYSNETKILKITQDNFVEFIKLFQYASFQKNRIQENVKGIMIGFVLMKLR